MWQETSQSIGLDLNPMVERARVRSAMPEKPHLGFATLVEQGRALLAKFASHVRGVPEDPLVPASVLKQDKQMIAAAQAVASAVRHLSQREAAFEREALYKAALDFGLPTTIGEIETRTRALVNSGHLVAGRGEHMGWLASREAIETEERIIAEVQAGKGESASDLNAEEAESLWARSYIAPASSCSERWRWPEADYKREKHGSGIGAHQEQNASSGDLVTALRSNVRCLEQTNSRPKAAIPRPPPFNGYSVSLQAFW